MSTFLRLICILFLVAASSALADRSTAKLVGTVTDTNGGAISNARLLVHWDRSGADVGLATNIGLPNDLSIQSNEVGEFVSELSPGFYDLFISATAFSPDCHKIRIKVGETLKYNAKLKPDPLVTKELGFFITEPK